MAKLTIDNICESINRRIQSMDYKTEKKIREFLEDRVDDGVLEPRKHDVREIANILDVNENCIQDILEDED